jgi:hypothetical protein
MNVEETLAIPTRVSQVIYDTITSQDFQQKSNMVISVSLELYRVMVSSLLLLFVPQKCGDHICSLNENIDKTDPLYKTGFIINYITVAAFVIMYIVEIRREEKLIKLLEVNNTISTDSQSVENRIQIFPEYKKQQLYNVVRNYQYAGYFAIVVFIINTIYSWRIIYINSLGNQTLLNFVTNILFMFSKLSNVLVIIHTENHVYLSAYLNTKVQFNDIDPREIRKLKSPAELNGDLVLELMDGGGFRFTSIEVMI